MRGNSLVGFCGNSGFALVLLTAACSAVEEPEAKTSTVAADLGALTTGDFQHRARYTGAKTFTGDYNGDGLADIAILPSSYSPNNAEIWVGFSQGSGNIAVTKHTSTMAGFNYYQPPGTPPYQIASGDFNGDGKDDLAAIGWVDYIVVWPIMAYAIGFTDGLGHFNDTQWPYSVGLSQDFQAWSLAPGARLLACDVNGDGKDDLVTTGANYLHTIPVAFSNGDGSFTVTNHAVTDFPVWTRDQGAKVACDDFNADGRDDLVVIGGAGWYTVPVAFSNGNGTFTVTNSAPPSLPSWAREPGAQLVTGDIDGNGSADLILTGASIWNSSVYLGIAAGNGHWLTAAPSVSNFPLWAREPQSQARGGDFNGDGRGDVVLVGGADYWYTLPIAISNGNYTFGVLNQPVP